MVRLVARAGQRGGGQPDGRSAHMRFLLPVAEAEFAISSVLGELKKDPWPVDIANRPQRATGVAISIATSLVETAFPNTGCRVQARARESARARERERARARERERARARERESAREREHSHTPHCARRRMPDRAHGMTRSLDAPLEAPECPRTRHRAPRSLDAPSSCHVPVTCARRACHVLGT
eukprot:2714104-Prymnesium_polylepis.1